MDDRRYTAIELVMAGAVLGILLSAFGTTLSTVRTMENRYLQEQAAISVLDNTVEHLTNVSAISEPELTALVAGELARVTCPRHDELTAEVSIDATSATLRIYRHNRGPLADVRVPLTEGRY